MALIEAKAEHLPPTHGLEQAKAYAAYTLSPGKVASLEVPVPSLGEQESILSVLGERIEPAKVAAEGRP